MTNLPACGAYVFGYSTGHVGTTTLSRSSTYAHGGTNKTDVAFFFELDHSFGHTNTIGRHGLSIAEQENHVRNVYLKEMSQRLGQRRARICVDLSHFHLHYFEGLLRVMRAERRPLKLVRIRRDAVEVARSLGASFAVGYRPSDAPESLVLSLNESVYQQFDSMEKGLYDADETEAQWRRLLEDWNGEIFTCRWAEWKPMGLDFVDQCVKPIARLLGLQPAQQVEDTKNHHNREESVADRLRDLPLLEQYSARMSNASPMYRLMGHTLPSGLAHGDRLEVPVASISEVPGASKAHLKVVGFLNRAVP